MANRSSLTTACSFTSIPQPLVERSRSWSKPAQCHETATGNSHFRTLAIDTKLRCCVGRLRFELGLKVADIFDTSRIQIRPKAFGRHPQLGQRSDGPINEVMGEWLSQVSARYLLFRYAQRH